MQYAFHRRFLRMLNSNYQMMDTLHFFCRYLYICSIIPTFEKFDSEGIPARAAV